MRPFVLNSEVRTSAVTKFMQGVAGRLWGGRLKLRDGKEKDCEGVKGTTLKLGLHFLAQIVHN